MLANQFLPDYHFKTRHDIALPGKNDDLFQKMLHTPTKHWLISFLFRLRGISQINNPGDIEKMGFRLLGEIKDHEIAHGIMSTNAFFHGCMEKFSPEEFQQKYSTGYLRGMIVFGVEGDGNTRKVFTETRVHCGSKKILKQFRLYWFFVKPFSSMIRKIMLKELKKSIEKISNKSSTSLVQANSQ